MSRGVVGACLGSTRRLFQVRGADTVKFLHGSVTVNVNKLHPEGLYGAMLNVQGPFRSEGGRGEKKTGQMGFSLMLS